jgi:nitrogen fixation/metabolism regulation signal transduction histidine kinase
MAFKRFEYRLTFRISLLAVTIFLFSWVLFTTDYYYTACILFLFIPLQGWMLMQLVNKTNRKLTSFFSAIRHAEFNYNFSAQEQGSAFTNLNQIMDEIVAQFRTIKQNKEEQYYFYQSVIQHIGVCLIAYKSNGDVIMANNAANKLFGFQCFTQLEQLNEIDTQLYSTIRGLEDGQKQLVKIQLENELYYLSIHVKTIRQESGIIKVVGIQNIQTELEQQEIESWQKLIRVLTHEIMNSITPVTSLTDTLKTMLDSQKSLGEESMEDVKLAINTIHKRSNGLLQFVETYRNLTKIPQPSFCRIDVGNFLPELRKLFENECREKKIDLQIDIQNQELEMMADESMMERVMINLIRNAIHAVADAENPQITIRSYLNSTGNVVFQVIDNGQGILPEVIDKIFIPFFTTRAGGSGIGLALSRQLIRAQGGTINAISKPGQTIFTVRL